LQVFLEKKCSPIPFEGYAMMIRNNLEVITRSLLVAFIVTGCGAAPAIFGGGSVLGVEYALINKTKRIYALKKEKIRVFVKKVLEQFEFRVLLNWHKRAGSYFIKAASNKYNIVISLHDVSSNATRVIVETEHKEYFFLKDEALENAILIELNKKLENLN
jgi:hypothetical protein